MQENRQKIKLLKLLESEKFQGKKKVAESAKKEYPKVTTPKDKPLKGYLMQSYHNLEAAGKSYVLLHEQDFGRISEVLQPGEVVHLVRSHCYGVDGAL